MICPCGTVPGRSGPDGCPKSLLSILTTLAWELPDLERPPPCSPTPPGSHLPSRPQLRRHDGGPRCLGGGASAPGQSEAQTPVRLGAQGQTLGSVWMGLCACTCFCQAPRRGVGGRCIQAAELKKLQGLGRREERRKLGGGGGGNEPERRTGLAEAGQSLKELGQAAPDLLPQISQAAV